MTTTPFAGQEIRISNTLSKIFKAQNKIEFVRILDSAAPFVELTESDNWNGGTYYYTLFLEIPVVVFAEIDSVLSKYEAEIGAKLQATVRETGNHILNRVVIRPKLIESAVLDSRSEREREGAIWVGKLIRIFISHQSADKVHASNLKASLSKFDIAAFVAHEDIEPTVPWQAEIKIALNTMDIFLALLTPNFRNSKWTDQEVGFAVSKNVPIIHVRDGQDPYGFIGETQSLSLSIENSDYLADEIVLILLKNNHLKPRMREALFAKLENVGGFTLSCKLMKLIETSGTVSESEICRIHNAAKANQWVRGAYTVMTFLESYPIKTDEIAF